MNISIVRAAEVVAPEGIEPNGLEKRHLPKGFPFLVEDSTQEIIEPVFGYMWGKYCRNGRYVENTVLAVAEDLRDWHRFLTHFKLRWDQIHREHIEQYRDFMFTLLSPQTNELYSIKTVKRRVGTVLSFYHHYNRKGITSIDFGESSIPVQRQPIDRNMLAHVRRPSQATTNDIPPRDSSGYDDEVRAFNKRQYRLVAEALGPRPDQRKNDTRPVRDRLWAELCLHTGMRPSEPAGITVYDVLNLSPEDPSNPAGLTFLRVVGKGYKVRKVQLPNLVLQWLNWYIDNERKQAIAEGRRRGIIKGRTEPSALFVNSVEARQNAGKPASYDTFRSSFHAAIVMAANRGGQSAGLLRTVLKVDPETQTSYTVEEPAFTPHCLRHSYSVWTYVAEKEQGNSEPWKELSAYLGHASIATTINTYLRVANEFETQLSDRVQAHLAARLKDLYQ